MWLQNNFWIFLIFFGNMWICILWYVWELKGLGYFPVQMLKGGTNGNNNALDVSLLFSILPLQNHQKIAWIYLCCGKCTKMMDWWGYLPLQRLKANPNGNNYALDVSLLFTLSQFLFIWGTILVWMFVLQLYSFKELT